MRWLPGLIRFIVAIYLLPVGCMFTMHGITDDNKSWWELRRDSSEQAPTAEADDEAIIQVYAARAARWRGSLGVHTWIATKRRSEKQYTRMEVIGYSVFRGGEAVRIRTGTPDNYWFGNRPKLLRDIRGTEKVEALIERLYEAANSYPYNSVYNIWPGPNSNTFTAYLARAVPEMRLDLPPTAIGKDYVPLNQLVSKSPSGTGVQISFKGYAGLLFGLEEGLELNVLGFTAGIDLFPPAVKLPAAGRIGFSDYRYFTESDLTAR